MCYLHFGYKICLLSYIVWYFECIGKNFVPLDQSLAIKPVAHKLPYFWFTQNRMNGTSCLVNKGIYTGYSINYKVFIFSIISENLFTYFCGLHCHVYAYRTIQRNCPLILRRTPIFGLYCLNPMRRQFGDRKISRRTEGPEGDFVGPQTLFTWDLHS